MVFSAFAVGVALAFSVELAVAVGFLEDFLPGISISCSNDVNLLLSPCNVASNEINIFDNNKLEHTLAGIYLRLNTVSDDGKFQNKELNNSGGAFFVLSPPFIFIFFFIVDTGGPAGSGGADGSAGSGGADGSAGSGAAGSGGGGADVYLVGFKSSIVGR